MGHNNKNPRNEDDKDMFSAQNSDDSKDVAYYLKQTSSCLVRIALVRDSLTDSYQYFSKGYQCSCIRITSVRAACAYAQCVRNCIPFN